MKLRVLLVSLFCLHLGHAQSIPPTPCPQTFRYESDGFNTYGIIVVPNSFGSQLNIDLRMSLPAQLPNSYYGKIDVFEDRSRLSSKLAAGLPIQYKVDFPLPRPLPYLISVSFNGRVICSGPGAPGGLMTTINLHHNLQTGNSGNYQQQQNNYQVVTQAPQQQQNNYQIVTQAPQQQQYDPYQTVTQAPRPQQSYNINQEATQQPQYNAQPQNTYQQVSQSTESSQLGQSYYEITTPKPQAIAVSSNPPQRYSTNEICGMRQVEIAAPLIVNGDTTERGEWPWLTAVYQRKTGALEFICGSSLISDRLVVTAAHCVTDSNRRVVNYEKIVLRLGVYNLEDWGDSYSATRTVSQIKLNNYFKDYTFSNDIAVLVMSQDVDFTDYIRPVCLWGGSDDQNEIVGQEGIVVGWGKDSEGSRVTQEPKKITVPIVSLTTCRGSNPLFFDLTSDTTICGGAKQGAGPCTGDSGGGLYLKKDQRWYLRGIVSNAIKGDQLICDLNQYVVYTDCAKFVSWINSQ
jgi:hypothetical protein